jgi:hypothetical protein
MTRGTSTQYSATPGTQVSAMKHQQGVPRPVPGGLTGQRPDCVTHTFEGAADAAIIVSASAIVFMPFGRSGQVVRHSAAGRAL